MVFPCDIQQVLPNISYGNFLFLEKRYYRKTVSFGPFIFMHLPQIFQFILSYYPSYQVKKLGKKLRTFLLLVWLTIFQLLDEVEVLANFLG